MRTVPTKPRSMADALALGPYLLRQAMSEPVLGASVVSGPAVVLGAMQRAERVVDLDACAKANVPVWRRATTGTAAWIGETGIVLTLVLPYVAALVPDATFRTLLNRNVRPFLRAFTRAGAMAHYFGREWISAKPGPLAILGFDVMHDGRVLIEGFVGCERAIAIPDELKAAEERALDRFLGKTPVSLRDVLPDVRGLHFAERVVEAMAEKGANHFLDEAELEVFRPQLITRGDDPLPLGFVSRTLERVPIGYVEGAVSRDEPDQTWLGGDVLAPRWVYEDLARDADAQWPEAPAIDGAKLEDLRRIAAMVGAQKENAPG